jgi:riboflavin kinase/FMN adenylyltransferase
VRTFAAIEEVPDGFGPSAVTIGKFDGVHLGHRAILGRLLDTARRADLAAVVVTFDSNPLSLFAPDTCPPDLVSLDQKLELLEDVGVDAALVLHFDRELSQVPAEQFVERFLVSGLHTRTVVTGRDFRFGFKGAGDVALVQRLGAAHGYSVEVVDDVEPDGQLRVSSSHIRALLAEGDVAHAAGLLGRATAVRGVVVHGAQRGRALGFPTANLSPHSEGLIPADGVYAGWLVDAGIRYPAAISVGDNPTFDGVPQRQVEAYAIDADLDLYDHIIDVEFTRRLRGMVAFQGVDALIAQMHADVAEAKALLVG